jgi:predicted lactoylglutathione lyase
MLVMQSASEVQHLQAAFIAAGGTGDAPENQLMYTTVYSCSVRDPFGTDIMIYCPLPD